MGKGLRKLVLFIDRYGRGDMPLGWSEPHKQGTVRILLAAALMVAHMCFAFARLMFRPGLRSRIRYAILGAAASHIGTGKPPVKDGGRIHIIGYLRSETGLGESARSSIRAFAKVGIRTSLSDVPSSLEVPWAEPLEVADGQSEGSEINLVHLNPDGLLGQLPQLLGGLEGRYNIGYWVWEVTRWPRQWKRAFDAVHEIWTPTRFSRNMIARHTDIPVVRVPHNVAPEVPESITRKYLGLPESAFLFLSIVDFRSLPERKNPIGAIEAYSRAVGATPEDVFFVLKTANMAVRPDVRARIEGLRRVNPSLILMEGYLDRLVLNGLINCCDCFVSLHRSEGFGLTLAEAMYMGKPVIATGYSGNMDFMHEGNSLPVRYTLARLENDIVPYPRGSEWATPDLDHAAELMQRVLTDESLRLEIGGRAEDEIRRNFSPEAAGRLMAGRLDLIVRESVDTEDRVSQS